MEVTFKLKVRHYFTGMVNNNNNSHLSQQEKIALCLVVTCGGGGSNLLPPDIQQCTLYSSLLPLFSLLSPLFNCKILSTVA